MGTYQASREDLRRPLNDKAHGFACAPFPTDPKAPEWSRVESQVGIPYRTLHAHTVRARALAPTMTLSSNVVALGESKSRDRIARHRWRLGADTSLPWAGGERASSCLEAVLETHCLDAVPVAPRASIHSIRSCSMAPLFVSYNSIAETAAEELVAQRDRGPTAAVRLKGILRPWH